MRPNAGDERSPDPGALRRSELSSFWDELVAASSDLPRLLDLIVVRACEIVGEGAVLTVVSEDGTTLEPVAFHHPDPNVLEAMRATLDAQPVPIGQGVAGRVAADRKPAIINDVDPSFTAELMSHRGQTFAARYPNRALLIVPMLAGRELIGTLGVVRTTDATPYDDDDRRAVEALAERAALAIADARSRPSPLRPEDYEAIFRHSLDGVLFTSPDGQIIAANPAACEILEMTEVEICRNGRSGLLFSDDPATTAALAERARTGRARARLPMRRGSGAVFTADVASTIFGSGESETRACVFFRDVTEEERLRHELEQRAHQLEDESLHDPLTGLFNRRGFDTASREAIAIATREQATLQLVFIDLDDLKGVNDRRGHAAGDQFILAFTAALRASVREADVSARIGGDEFAILLFRATTDEADRIVSRIEAHLREVEVSTFSAGIVGRPPESTATLEDLLARADRRMYEHKLTRRFRPPPGAG